MTLLPTRECIPHTPMGYLQLAHPLRRESPRKSRQCAAAQDTPRGYVSREGTQHYSSRPFAPLSRLG